MNSPQLPPRRKLSADDSEKPKKKIIERSEKRPEPTKGFTRNRIFGLIGVVWGGAALINFLMSGEPISFENSREYGNGLGVLTMSLMLGIGGYYLVNG